MTALAEAPAAPVSVRRGVVPLAPRVRLTHGGVLEGGRVAFEALGAPDLPAVAVLGGISAGRHVVASDVDPTPGWWEAVAGPGRTLDPGRFRLIGIDWLGGAGSSSGPDAIRDADEAGKAVDTRDQSAALAAVLDSLGIERLHALVGASYGGMVGLAFAARWPERLSRLVCIAAPHCTHPMATAIRSAQRRIVRLGLATGAAAEALALARGLAMTTYRTDREFAARFDARPRADGGAWRFPVDAYLDHHGARFVRSFTPEAFLSLSESLDLHDVPPGDVTTPTTVVAVASDTLVPPWQLEALHRGLGGPARLVRIASDYGHDAFLKESEAIGAVLHETLEVDR